MLSFILSNLSRARTKAILNDLQTRVEEINGWSKIFKDADLDVLSVEASNLKTTISRLPPPEIWTEIQFQTPKAFALLKKTAELLAGTEYEICGCLGQWNFSPYDTQLLGGLALADGMIAEMETGEGKTLSSVFPLFLMALAGRGAHLITANDYLALRDSQFASFLLKNLGMAVGVLLPGQTAPERKAQYEKDITYGSAQEFVFDYLKDNSICLTKADQVQRTHFFALVDEADSLLIDEAKMPMVISGQPEGEVEVFGELKPLVENLWLKQKELCSHLVDQATQCEPGSPESRAHFFLAHRGAPTLPALRDALKNPKHYADLESASLFYSNPMRSNELASLSEELFYTVNELEQTAELTKKGRDDLAGDEMFVIHPPSSPESNNLSQELIDATTRIHCFEQLLKAYAMYEKDVHYIVEDNQIVIVDEHTGRKRPGRRWCDGLHQAVEAKEGLPVLPEPATLASATVQNYFRLYEKLAGMTGTASTDAEEFLSVYGLEVVSIPTNKPRIREDLPDRVFRSHDEKFDAVVQEIKRIHDLGRPVLVGTRSVEESEMLSSLLEEQSLFHSVLNARNHANEADVISRAGSRGAITISTNMAGRGTDIKLGPGVSGLGGLHVIGTERHESRRVDNQLRGRSGRQGDPGSSQFFLSLDDSLLRRYGSGSKIIALLDAVGFSGEVSHPILDRIISSAQRKIERANFSQRRRTIDFDDVLFSHRNAVFSIRQEALETGTSKILPDFITRVCADLASPRTPLSTVRKTLKEVFLLDLPEPIAAFSMANPTYMRDVALHVHSLKEKLEGVENQRKIEKLMLLRILDGLWRTHLSRMEDLAEDVGLRVYAQRNPVQEYKKEAFSLFKRLMYAVQTRTITSSLVSTAKMEETTELFKDIVSKIPLPPLHSS